MALQRYVAPRPTSFRGLETLAPPELREFVSELVRRLEHDRRENFTAQQANLVADPAILPTLNGGASEAFSYNVATIRDAEASLLLAIMFS